LAKLGQFVSSTFKLSFAVVVNSASLTVTKEEHYLEENFTLEDSPLLGIENTTLVK
jgi:hypothetical protein